MSVNSISAANQPQTAAKVQTHSSTKTDKSFNDILQSTMQKQPAAKTSQDAASQAPKAPESAPKAAL